MTAIEEVALKNGCEVLMAKMQRDQLKHHIQLPCYYLLLCLLQEQNDRKQYLKNL